MLLLVIVVELGIENSDILHIYYTLFSNFTKYGVSDTVALAPMNLRFYDVLISYTSSILLAYMINHEIASAMHISRINHICQLYRGGAENMSYSSTLGTS
jgi:hypothetical protein